MVEEKKTKRISSFRGYLSPAQIELSWDWAGVWLRLTKKACSLTQSFPKLNTQDLSLVRTVVVINHYVTSLFRYKTQVHYERKWPEQYQMTWWKLSSFALTVISLIGNSQPMSWRGAQVAGGSGIVVTRARGSTGTTRTRNSASISATGKCWAMPSTIRPPAWCVKKRQLLVKKKCRNLAIPLCHAPCRQLTRRSWT